MAYIGRSVNYGNAVTQQLDGNAGAGYTLNYDTTTDGVIISLDGVTQVNGTDFNILGTALTFDEAVASGIKINVIYLGLTISIGVPGDGTVGIAKLSTSGTASSSTFLRGDNTWASVAATAFPFYKADGSLDSITIASGNFPFYKADGTLDNIGVS